MKKIIFRICFFVLVFSISFFCLSFRPIAIESKSESVFEIDKEFSDFRKSLKEEDLMNKTIEAAGGTIVEKNWIDAKVNVKRPILKNWKFSGDVVFKFYSEYNDKQIFVNMKQNLLIENDHIKCENKLIEPIKEMDLSQYDQQIEIKKINEKTLIKLNLVMKINKIMPYFLKSYAQKQLDKEVEKQICNLKNELEELSKKNTNSISIKLK